MVEANAIEEERVYFLEIFHRLPDEGQGDASTRIDNPLGQFDFRVDNGD